MTLPATVQDLPAIGRATCLFTFGGVGTGTSPQQALAGMPADLHGDCAG